MSIIDNFRKSLPKKSVIHGVEIKKLPLGAYLDAIDTLKNLPETLLKNSFPGKSPDEILKMFQNLNSDTLLELAGNLLATVPDQALHFISCLIGVEYERLRNDPEIGLNGIKDVLVEFWKLNNLSDFFTDAGKAVKSSSLLKQMANGFKN
jgi:hypothetical protein